MSHDVMVNEISKNVFRFSIAPTEHFEFSQFLLLDDEPCLVHAGKSSLFESMLSAVKQKLNGKALKYIVFSHVESDESGGANKWLVEFPEAVVVCNRIANISLDDALCRPAQIIKDGEVIPLGNQRLRMIETPHFPHNWDAHLWFEETQGILFSSDFCCQGGICPAIATNDISESIIKFYEKGGFIPYGVTTNQALEKLGAIPLNILAPMHGSVIGFELAATVFRTVKTDLQSRSIPI